MFDLVVERVLVNDEDTIVELGSVSGFLRRSDTRRLSMDGSKTDSASVSDSGEGRRGDLDRSGGLRRELGGWRIESGV
jgi:hypothetical protein